MATAQYVSAMILDVTSILRRGDINTINDNLQRPPVQNVAVSQTLNKAVALHANVLE